MALPQTLSLSSGHQGRIDDLRLPNAIPTVSSINDTAQVIDKNGQYWDLTLGHSQCFTGNDLAQKLQAHLVTIPGSWTVTYNAAMLTLEVKCNEAFAFTGGTFMKPYLNRPFTRADSKSFLFLYAPLQGLVMCYLCCPNFSNADNAGPKHSSDVLCAIPITVGYGSVQHYSMSNSVYFDIPAVILQQLSFQLRDRDYNIVNSIANISFTLTID
jgi:hypothetical protein